MLLKIITILSTISISVDCILPEHEPKHAVSSQSYHRDDVPLSYKFSSVHVYTTPQPEQRPSDHQQNNLQYNKIQFAPLGQNSSQYEKIIEEQEDLHEREKSEQQRQYLSELNAKYHLEPRLQVAADNLDVHAHNYRSHTPGHNVQVLQSNRAHDHNDPYHAHPQRLQNIQLSGRPRPVIRYSITEEQQQMTTEKRPHSDQHHILYTLVPWPIANSQQNANEIVYPQQTLHQAPSAKINRLHLNVARIYGVSHSPQQQSFKASQPLINRPNMEKPPSHTQAIFKPLQIPFQQKTILYAVPNNNKNYLPTS